MLTVPSLLGRDVSPCVQRQSDRLLQHLLVHWQYYRSRRCQRRSRSVRKLFMASARLAPMSVSRNHRHLLLVHSRVTPMALCQQQARVRLGNPYQVAWTRKLGERMGEATIGRIRRLLEHGRRRQALVGLQRSVQEGQFALQTCLQLRFQYLRTVSQYLMPYLQTTS